MLPNSHLVCSIHLSLFILFITSFFFSRRYNDLDRVFVLAKAAAHPYPPPQPAVPPPRRFCNRNQRGCARRPFLRGRSIANLEASLLQRWRVFVQRTRRVRLERGEVKGGEKGGGRKKGGEPAERGTGGGEKMRQRLMGRKGEN